MFSAQAKPKKEDGNSGNAFDSLLGDESSNSGVLTKGKPKENGHTDGTNNGNPYDSDSDDFAPKPKPKENTFVPKQPAPSKKRQFDFSDSDSFEGGKVAQASSDDEFIPGKKKGPRKKTSPDTKKKIAFKKAAPVKEKKPKEDSENDWSNDEEVVKASPVQQQKNKPKGRPKKLLAADGSDDSDFVQQQKNKPKGRPKKLLAANDSDDSDFGATAAKSKKPKLSDFDVLDDVPARERPGRSRKVAAYNFGDDSDSDTEFA